MSSSIWDRRCRKESWQRFQYALKPNGYLFLGTSESISDYSDAFTPVDQRNRIFLRKPSAATFRETHSATIKCGSRIAAPARLSASTAARDRFPQRGRRRTAGALRPGRIGGGSGPPHRAFPGRYRPYLAPPTGQPSFHLLKMVRPEFVVELRTAISKARKENVATGREIAQVDFQGRPGAVRLDVRPLPRRNGKKQDLLVVFQRLALPEAEEVRPGGRRGDSTRQHAEKSSRLERELVATREHLRGLIAEHETAQEEMKAANEEILSSNEELQSTNEELETAKEELQSSNEELVTLNDELQHRNVRTQRAHARSGQPSCRCGYTGARARRRPSRAPFHTHGRRAAQSDSGRRRKTFQQHRFHPGCASDWKEVFEAVKAHGNTVEREVADRGGHRYSMRVRPYKTDDNRIDGVLVVLLDTDAIFRARDDARPRASTRRPLSKRFMKLWLWWMPGAAS